MGPTFLLAVSLLLAGVTCAQGSPWPTRTTKHQHEHHQLGQVSDSLHTESDSLHTESDSLHTESDRDDVVSERTTLELYRVPPTTGGEVDTTISESRNQPVVERQVAFPGDDQRYQLSHSETRPVVRRGLGARRRRLLNPERRRQLRLRRQKLGLPIIKRARNRHQLPEKQTQDTDYSSAGIDPTEPTTSISTSTSSSISFSSVSSSSSTTTSRSAFPSFRAAAKLRQRVKKIRGGWGMKTSAEVDGSETTEDESHELESILPVRRRLAERRRGLPKVLKRPLPMRLSPTPVPSSTTTSTPTEAPKEEKRLRHLPERGSKKLRLKVKTTTVRSPSYEPFVSETERPSNEHNSAVYEHEPQSSDDNSPVYNPEAPFLNNNSPVYNSERPYHKDDLLIYEPSYTPMPKKVVLEPLATTSRTQHEPAYTRRNIYDQVPVLTSNAKYASVSLNSPDVIYSPDPVFSPEAVKTPDSAPGSDEASEEGYNDSEEYTDSVEDKPGIFDQYKYGYNVESEATGNYQARYEARDGQTVSGSYKVALPDGRIQVVTYVADDMGFRAEVNYEGEEKTHTTPITPTKKSSVGIVEPAPRLAQDQESHQGPDYFPVHDSHPVRDPAHSSPRPHASGHYPSTQPVLASLADQKLHFHNYVTTASPNPFRLVVEKGRASTLAPPPFSTTPAATHSTNTHTYNIVKQLTTTPAPPVATTPKTLLATPVTNSHVMDNGFMRTVVARNRQPFSPSNYPGAPATATKATNSHAMTPHTVYQDHTPTSVYQYTAEDSPASHTTLYSPDAKAVAYIQALGRSHLVPVLLPYTPRPQEHSNSPFPHTDVPTHSRQHQDISTFPQHNILPLPTRTYYLNRQSRAPGTHDLQGFHDGDSVEILRGDDRRPRLSLKVPAPHEADIYPSRPPFYHH